jgi:T5SS/PEP-CTERM-associated repeat protein
MLPRILRFPSALALAALVSCAPLRAEYQVPLVLEGTSTNYEGELRLGGTRPKPALAILKGGSLLNSGRFWFGAHTTSGDRALVADPGSRWVNTNEVFFGWESSGNALVVSNGASVETRQMGIGYTGKNNSVVVTGPDSTWSNRFAISLGLHRTGEGNALVVAHGAKVSTGTAVVGATGSRNQLTVADGGRFSAAGPIQVAGSPGSRDNVVRVEGEGSLLEVTRAGGLFIGQTAEFGDPTEQLEILGEGGVSAPVLFVANTGMLLASNTVSMVRAAAVTNAGVVRTLGSEVAWLGQQFVVAGRFSGHGSTNRFSGGVRVVAGATWTHGQGGILDFGRDLAIESTNDLSGLRGSAVRFSGGVEHALAFCGPDFGPDGAGPKARPLAFARLALGSTNDSVAFSGVGGGTNALYVGELDLLGDTNLVARLRAPAGVRVYYAPSHRSPANSYLRNATWTLQGGGVLLPGVPFSGGY